MDKGFVVGDLSWRVGNFSGEKTVNSCLCPTLCSSVKWEVLRLSLCLLERKDHAETKALNAGTLGGTDLPTGVGVAYTGRAVRRDVVIRSAVRKIKTI